MVVGLLAVYVGQAQVSNPSNNALAGDYVGCDNTSPFPLEIRQNDNQPIQWFTDAIQRLMLYPTNNATLNTFNVPRNGFVGISPQPLFFNNPGAFTRLHDRRNLGQEIKVYRKARSESLRGNEGTLRDPVVGNQNHIVTD